MTKHPESTRSTDSGASNMGKTIPSEIREATFRYRAIAYFSEQYSTWVAECLETGHVVTADNVTVAKSMIAELLEDETDFAMKHNNLKNLFSNPARIDIWRKFLSAKPTEPQTVYEESLDMATVEIRTERISDAAL